MKNLNKEMRNLVSYPGHFCSKRIIEMILSHPEQQCDVSDNFRLYTLRTRSKKFNVEDLPETNNLRALHGLLCKPVSVNVKKLPNSEMERVSRSRHKMQTNKAKNHNEMVKRKAKIKQTQVSDWLHVKKNASISTRKTARSNNNLSTENLLKSIRQPYIKLRRIDEVINKIAQSFAKVISNKQCNTSVRMKKPGPEIVDLISEPSDVLTNKCLEENNSETSTSNLNLDDSLQSNDVQSESYESDIDINKNASRRVLKRKRKVLYDSDNDSSSSDNEDSNSYKVFSKNAKALNLNLSDKEIEDRKDVEIIEATENSRHTNKMPMLETKSLQNLKVCNELHNLSNEQNSRIKNIVSHCNLSTVENMSSESCHDNVNKIITQPDNASSLVPSDVTCATEINALQTLNDEDTQNQITKSIVSDKDLRAKYNLLKELRVSLIQLDHIKCSTNNRYSALEVEQLTRQCMKVLNNFEFVNVELPLVDKEMELDENSDKIDIVEFMEHKPILNSNVHELLEDMQIRQQADLNDQEISYNMVKFPTIVSQLNASDRSPATKSPIKVSKLSRVTENIIKTGQSGNRLHTSTTDEVCSMNKELPEISLHKISPKKSSNNGKVKSSESIQTNAYNIILSKAPVPSHNEKVLISGRKTFVTKIHAKTVNIINPKVNTKKNLSSCHPTVSSSKHKKSVDKKDSNKSNGYKCIVCDVCFENYSDLQHHLITHTQKQNNNALPSSSNESTPIHSQHSENLQDAIHHSSKSKKAESVQLSEQESATQTISPSSTQNKAQQNKGTSTQGLPKKKNYFSKQRSKFMNTLSKPSECTICSKVFPTATDLAAHIFLHTEHELQKAFEAAKRRKEAKRPPGKPLKVVEKVRIPRQCSVPSVIQVPQVTNVLAIVTSTTAAVTVPLNTVITVTDPSKTNKLPVVSGNSSEELQLPPTQSKSEKKKAKKRAKMCNCHSTMAETNDDCLMIEIALLCHGCKVLFRSMDCFDKHYDLPEYKFCNENRVHISRTPNLLCAACGIIFPSVQDVRHHLENHARVKRNCKMDFRCKICKVMFIGVGALFYVHWSNHLQDPYWIANEKTFPKNSVVNPQSEQSKEIPSTSKETYILVAEHICNICKIPFVTDGDLKRHSSKCKPSNDSGNSNTEKPLEIEVNCSLCNDIFTEKLAFYRHVRSKHNFISEPQFVCVSLTLIKTAYICNICMEISESMDEFEDHWLKHSTATVCFTCTYCSKAYCNGLNAFLEHAKMHEVNVKQYVLSCTVNYEKTSFICKHCNIGFSSEKALNDHNIIHKLNQSVDSTKTATSDSEMNQISDVLKSTDLTSKKQKEDNTSQLTEQTNEVSPVESDKDMDRERLINILEGTEDDSEHELIIDWTEKPEEENELSEEKRNKEKQGTLDDVLDTSSTVQDSTVSKSDTINASTQNAVAQVSEKSTASVASETRIENPKTCTDTAKITVISIEEDKPEASKESECLNVQNAEDNNPSGSTKDQEEPTVSKKNSPPRVRQGFLRVKSLAELTSKTTPTKDKQNELPGSSSSIVFHHPSVSGKHVTAAAATSVIIRQHLKQTNIRVNQVPRSMQNSKSAYHKNLPTCNIARPASAVPRFVHKANNASAATAAAGCSRLQNQRGRYPTPRFTSPPSCANIVNGTRNVGHPNSNVPNPLLPKTSNTDSSHKGHNVATENRGYSNGNPLTTTKAAAVNNSQNPKQYASTSPIISYQYPCFITTNATNDNEMMQNSQQMMINPSGETSTIYYKNPNNSSGGMSIVINQTTPAVQNIPTINIVGQEQQQMYQPQVYRDPTIVLDHSYAQQAQNVNDFSPSANVYQIVTREFQLQHRDNSSTYNVHLPAPIFICSHCPKTISFSSAELLEMHVNMNHKFLCDTCGQRSYSFNELNVHKMKHNFI